MKGEKSEHQMTGSCLPEEKTVVQSMSAMARVIPTLFLVGSQIWFLSLASIGAAQKITPYPAHSKYAFTFPPIRLDRLHRHLLIEVKGLGVYKKYGHDRIRSVVATLYSVAGKTRHKLSSTTLEDYELF